MRSIFCGLLTVISHFSLAQNIMPSVTNLAGYEHSSSGLVTTVSIGEPAILTLASDNNIITQGFLQPEVLPCPDVSFSYYPNPTRGEITIEASGCEVKIKSIQILDVWGRLLITFPPTPDNKMELGFLSSGVYIMKIFLTNGQFNAVNIVKVS
ncbi:MAG: T9SS type A sorting domain-containing protein [Bacteroidota bacterium]